MHNEKHAQPTDSKDTHLYETCYFKSYELKDISQATLKSMPQRANRPHPQTAKTLKRRSKNPLQAT